MNAQISVPDIPVIERAESPREEKRFRLPAPSPDIRAYRFNRYAALAISPRKLVNYVRYKRAQRSATVHYLPIKMDIENVSRCNFHCTMCQVSDWPKFKRADDMSFEDYKRLIKSQKGLVEIKLQGMGEPLMGKSYFDMIRFARRRFIWVRSTTNASLLHINDNYKKLIDSGINEIQISFDGATKQTFEKIRRGSKFERVVENCKLINEYCNSRNMLRTRMWVVVQHYNINEFFDFVRLAHEMGFKRLTFSLNLHGWGQEVWEAANNSVMVEDAVSLEMAEQAMEMGRELGVEVTFWHIVSKYSTKSPDQLCAWPFERAYVSSDMRIVPCCMIANPEVSDLGDATAFTAEWQSDTYEQFRQAHLDGEIPEMCKSCYLQDAQA